jgi:hypothetical protein
MLQRLRSSIIEKSRPVTWRSFAIRLLAVFAGGIAGLYAFVLLIDPYNVIPFSLPIERPLVSINQRYMYPQVVRSGRFDSFVVGTSTSRLLDPDILNAEFGVKFANLAMDSATAWEQKTMADYFIDRAGQPRVMIVGIDRVWCEPDADGDRITFRGFPEFLYDDSKWNDYLYLLNLETIEIAGRLLGNRLGLYPTRSRYDGFQIFVPPDATYDAEKARRVIWSVSQPQRGPDKRGFPALQWLDDLLGKSGEGMKIIAFMPVHIAAQPMPSSEAAAVEAQCKARIIQIAARRGARVIDWRYPSSLTRQDSNYWDSVHYRIPIAQRLVRDMSRAFREGRLSEDDTYRLPLQ